MNPDINTALILLLVGMLSVFAVLAILVVSAKVLINLLNRWHNDETDVVKRVRRSEQSFTDSIEKKKMVAIMTAIDVISNGKGRVTHIEKI